MLTPVWNNLLRVPGHPGPASPVSPSAADTIVPILLFLLRPLRWQPLLSCWPATDDRALSTTPSTAESELRSSVNYRVHAPAPGRSVVPPWAPRGSDSASLHQAGRAGRGFSLSPRASEVVGQQSCLSTPLCPGAQKGGQNGQAPRRGGDFWSWPEESMT